jgi:hypothetical protein
MIRKIQMFILWVFVYVFIAYGAAPLSRYIETDIKIHNALDQCEHGLIRSESCEWMIVAAPVEREER